MHHLPIRLLFVLSMFIAAQLPSFAEVKVLAKGDYTSASTAQQQFIGSINLNEVDNTMPFTLTFENGRFQWVRVFLTDSSAARRPVSAAPTGYMIVSESGFRNKQTVAVDMTGRIKRGNTTLLIRGAGMPGSTFKWSLTTVTGMRITMIEPKVVQGGGTVTISGAGFSSTVAQNSVLFNNKPGKIIDATEDTIRVQVPDSVTQGNISVQVIANGNKSNVINVAVIGMPELIQLSNQSQRSGQPLTITGKNFSDQIKDNEVRVGGQKAEITSASSESLSITVPFNLSPDQGDSPYFAPPREFEVSVKVGGVACKKTLPLMVGLSIY
jgi:hypothetical protein